jgi:hypothetical protein
MADPCVEVSVSASGELQLAALGELHLQRCVKDLETRFARCGVVVSPPILEFQETLAAAAAPARRNAAAAAFGGDEAGGDSDGDGGGGGSGSGGGGEGGGSALPQNQQQQQQQEPLISTANAAGGGVQYPVCWSWVAAAGGEAAPPPARAFFHPPSASAFAASEDGAVVVRLRAVPLPPALTELLSGAEASGALRELTAPSRRGRCYAYVAVEAGGGSAAAAAASAAAVAATPAHRFVRRFAEVCEDSGALPCVGGAPSPVALTWAALAHRVLALGPRGVGPNALFLAPAAVPPALTEGAWQPLWAPASGGEGGGGGSSAGAPGRLAPLAAALRSALAAGFALAMGAGPLAGEPVRGVGVVVEEVFLLGAGSAAGAPPFSSGAFLQAVREAVGAALGAGALRLAEPFYRCELRCSGGRGGGGEALGKCYAVLAKRRGRVVAEDVLEGTDTWVIDAFLPVAEVYGFADELRKRTSGAATSPQLLFSHWEVIQADPFFAPTTASEKEEFGDTLHAGQVRGRRRRLAKATSLP